MSFFVLDVHARLDAAPYATDAIAADPHNVGTDPPICETCGRPIGMLPWLPPYRVDLETWGRTFGDLAYCYGGDLLISERFKRMIQEHAVTGFEGFDPVEVLRVKRHKRFRGDPPKYYRVRVVRTRAVIDQTASGVEWDDSRPICQDCRVGGLLIRWARTILEPGTWTGEDVFLARGLAATYITSQRFKELCGNYSLRNVLLRPAEEYWADLYPSWNLSKAQEIMNQAPDSSILQGVTASGDILRYEVATNYLVIARADGTIVNVDRPADGIAFFRKLAGE